MKKTPLILICALGALLFLALLFTFQVRTTQIAVVSTFGKVTRTETEPGIYGKLPWPVQKVTYLDKRAQNFENDRFSEDFTADSYPLLTMVYVGWRITDPQLFLPRFPGGVRMAESKLGELVRSSKTAVVGRHPLSDFVSANNDGRFAAIENEILAALRAQVGTNQYGVTVEFLGIKRLGLPEQVTQTVFDQMTSERKLLADKSQYEGEAEAQRIRSDADRHAGEIVAAARGQALQIQGQGEAEAAQYLKVYEKNPKLAVFLFDLNAFEDSLRERSTLIFDWNTPPFDLLRGSIFTNLLQNPQPK